MPAIPELAAVSALDDDDLLVVVEDGVTKKITVAELRTAMRGEQIVETIEVGAGGAADIDFDSIPTDGTHLILRALLQWEADAAEWAGVQLNGNSSGYYQTYQYNFNDTYVDANRNNQSMSWVAYVAKSSAAQMTSLVMEIPFYRSSIGQIVAMARSATHTDGNYQTISMSTGGGNFPVTRVRLLHASSGDFKEGSRATLSVVR